VDGRPHAADILTSSISDTEYSETERCNFDHGRMLSYQQFEADCTVDVCRLGP
jgi:hypothetical protein